MGRSSAPVAGASPRPPSITRRLGQETPTDNPLVRRVLRPLRPHMRDGGEEDRADRGRDRDHDRATVGAYSRGVGVRGVALAKSLRRKLPMLNTGFPWNEYFYVSGDARRTARWRSRYHCCTCRQQETFYGRNFRGSAPRSVPVELRVGWPGPILVVRPRPFRGPARSDRGTGHEGEPLDARRNSRS
jgi:hypothetical protein